jgi:hypothetical protein
VRDEDEKRELTFDATEDELDNRTRVLLVFPRYIGCVTVVFDPHVRGGENVAVIESVKHDRRCAVEGLPRKYGTRAMMLGTLHVLRDLARIRYPHLKEIELNDEASYPCPPYDVPDDGKDIKTFATDLLLQGHTYYERHLGVRPRKPQVDELVRGIKRRMTNPIDVDFDTFWYYITDRKIPRDMYRSPSKMRWLHQHQENIDNLFERTRHVNGSWSAFFRALHVEYGCVFFLCCWWRLCRFFDMTRLMGAAWFIPFEDLPRPASLSISYEIWDDESNEEGRGGGDIGLRRGSVRRGGGMVNDGRKKITLARRVDREMRELVENKTCTAAQWRSQRGRRRRRGF